MRHSQDFKTRMRLRKDIEYGEDYRKKLISKDYGNYEKYEKNSVKEEREDTQKDQGYDMFMRNAYDMMSRMDIEEQDDIDKEERGAIEDLLTNKDILDNQYIKEFEKRKIEKFYPSKKQRELEQRFATTNELTETEYNGRMSPHGKEEVYRHYLNGMTVKDLSLKYGILPQRVKAIVYQKFLYWNEIYPRMGETHMRLAFERELFHAQNFPFIDYGLDLNEMAEMEQGVKVHKLRRSDVDVNPPK